jgi:hypothetical protein
MDSRNGQICTPPRERIGWRAHRLAHGGLKSLEKRHIRDGLETAGSFQSTVKHDCATPS